MRPRIVNLDVDQMPWKALGPSGLYSRELSRDPETGARTALQWLSMDRGYTPPATAHYHHTYEEIIGVSGHFSFDSRLWVTPYTYVFHPPETVHGFKSAIREESTFISRVGRDLDFNFVEQPIADDLYSVAETPSARTECKRPAQSNLAALAPATFLGAPARACVLSAHPQSGEGSALVELPAGWASTSEALPCYLELFVMEGGLSVDSLEPASGRAYFSYPPNDVLNSLAAPGRSLIYVNFGGAIGL
ncbi:hypothetical protein [Croceibacterium ferulae]|uniref:hypothetical protein n=1 Tax=Croceibacterium ferulae TaxID=1854641 RepID=UPI000EB2BD15|nr:hypothetical protein [Croceibacterium ferulae]